MRFYGVFQWDSEWQEYSYWIDAFETEESANQWVENVTAELIEKFAEWRNKYPDAYGPSLEDKTESINEFYEVRLVEVNK